MDRRSACRQQERRVRQGTNGPFALQTRLQPAFAGLELQTALTALQTAPLRQRTYDQDKVLTALNGVVTAIGAPFATCKRKILDVQTANANGSFANAFAFVPSLRRVRCETKLACSSVTGVHGTARMISDMNVRCDGLDDGISGAVLSWQ
jgi:hypothetical protein